MAERLNEAEAEPRGRACLERLLAARGQEVPYEAMAELIDLGRSHESVRVHALEEIEKQLWTVDRGLSLAWLCVVAGEVGRDGLLALIKLLGETESDDVMESSWPALTRHVVEVDEDIKRAIESSRVTAQRGMLYETLRGAVLLGDEALKHDLAEFARHRVERELKMWPRKRDALGPLSLLVYLGAPDAREWVARVRERTRDETDKADLQGLESHLLGSVDDPHEITRGILEDTWRDTSENLRKLFHPTEEEARQLLELAASLGRSGKEVH